MYLYYYYYQLLMALLFVPSLSSCQRKQLWH